MHNTSWHSQKYDFQYILQFPQKERKMIIWQQKINGNKSDWKKKKDKIPPFSNSANLGEHSIEFYNSEDYKRQSVIKQF